MSEPSTGTASKLSIRSVAGGFIVSWEVHAPVTGYALQAAQMGQAVTNMATVERVCAGMPALLALIQQTVKVTP
jgi:hypothetical protein